MIPDYQTLMLPLLKFIKDEQIHNTQEAIGHLAKEYNLTEEELNEWLPSKKQKTFANRVHWAKAFLKMVEAIENIKKGVFKITDRGLLILKSNPPSISVKYLMDKFPDFEEKINKYRYKKKGIPDVKTNENLIESTSTPEENLDSIYQQLRTNLEEELLSKLKAVSPAYFEKIVVDLLVKMGYGGTFKDAALVIGKPGDGGIDGLIKEDKLGLDAIYVQAKRWNNTVQREDIQKFVGALAGHKSKKGVFITTSSFSKNALEYIHTTEIKIVLIDGEQLASLMIDYNLGLSIQNTYEIKKIDSDYFEEE